MEVDISSVATAVSPPGEGYKPPYPITNTTLTKVLLL